MSSSAIIDLAIGLTFVFGVRAALSSALTELIARLTGLCGAYLLSGLRELVDNLGRAWFWAIRRVTTRRRANSWETSRD